MKKLNSFRFTQEIMDQLTELAYMSRRDKTNVLEILIAHEFKSLQTLKVKQLFEA